MARFIVRLLDEANALLGWAEVYASPRPQAHGASCPFWPAGPTAFQAEADGRVMRVSIHWADLDVARLKAVDPIVVTAGQTITLTWDEPIWLVPGMRDVPLPEVTVRAPAVVSVPVGSLNALATN